VSDEPKASTMIPGLVRIVAYVLLAVGPVVLAALLGLMPRSVVYELGRFCALAGFALLALQFLLAARIRWIERPFGFDILIRFHRHMAILATALIVAHPLLLAAGGAGTDLLLGLDQPWAVWLGKAALVLLLLNVLLSVFQRRVALDFEHWRLLHDILGPLVLVGAAVHAWAWGQDLRLFPLQVTWIIVTAVALGTYVVHRFVRPWWLAGRPYRVSAVRPEADGVWTIELTPPEGLPPLDYLPGQFHFVTFFRGRELPVEEHHWTISSSPTTDHLASTIKAVGDFTSTIGETRVGDTAAVHGPFGRYSYVLHPEERDLVFVAGGIGITPLMSMLRHMRDTRDERSVRLVYANRTESSIVFRDEIDEMATGEHPRLRVTHVLSRPGDEWTGRRGHVDTSLLREICGNQPESEVFYVCGPTPLRSAVIASLHELGVPDSRIRIEIFSFLD